jgi:hypothetical protein
MQKLKDLHMVYPCPFCGEIPDQPDDWQYVVCKTKRCPMRGKPVKMLNWNKQHCRQINPDQRVAPPKTEEADKLAGVGVGVDPQHGQPAISQLYNELLMAVAQKFSGESRHETALRYIRSVERNSVCGGVAKQQA